MAEPSRRDSICATDRYYPMLIACDKKKVVKNVEMFWRWDIFKV
jgi:hypothetical protein